jgi:probable HAF family extracellular repeat protein
MRCSPTRSERLAPLSSSHVTTGPAPHADLAGGAARPLLAARACLAVLTALVLAACGDAPPVAPRAADPAPPAEALGPAASAAGEALQVVDAVTLPTLGGHDASAADVNDAGQVVGWSTTAAEIPQAFLWSAATGMRDLGSLSPGPAAFSQAIAINEAGTVVGRATALDGFNVAFRWTASDGMVRLGEPPGGVSSMAVAVNAREQAAGQADLAGGVTHAVLWDPSTGVRDLGTLPGAEGSLAEGINDAGVVVGTAFGPNPRAFRWEAGTGMVDLTPPGARGSAAVAINNAGQILGNVLRESEAEPVIWEPDGRLTFLAAPGVDGPSVADLNAAGNVVGSIVTPLQDVLTTLWRPDVGFGVVRVPPALRRRGYQSLGAALNNAGALVGNVLNGAEVRAVVWRLDVAHNRRPVLDGVLVVPRAAAIGGLDGDLLQLRVRDAGDLGPWTIRIDWGDGTVDAPVVVGATGGTLSFLRRTPFPEPGAYTVTVTAADPSGAASAPRTVTLTVP